jgi:hypothetical protein
VVHRIVHRRLECYMPDREMQRRTVDRLVRLTDADMLQIEQAASGCLDKTIGYWPCLDHALSKLGIDLNVHTPATVVTAICQFVEAASETRLECMSCGQMRPHDEDVCGQCTYKTDGSDPVR